MNLELLCMLKYFFPVRSCFRSMFMMICGGGRVLVVYISISVVTIWRWDSSSICPAQSPFTHRPDYCIQCEILTYKINNGTGQ